MSDSFNVFNMRTTGRDMSQLEAEEHLVRVRTVSRWLDRIPGSPVPIGLDPIVGLLPAFGDFAGLAMSLYQGKYGSAV